MAAGVHHGIAFSGFPVSGRWHIYGSFMYLSRFFVIIVNIVPQCPCQHSLSVPEEQSGQDTRRDCFSFINAPFTSFTS